MRDASASIWRAADLHGRDRSWSLPPKRMREGRYRPKAVLRRSHLPRRSTRRFWRRRECVIPRGLIRSQAFRKAFVGATLEISVEPRLGMRVMTTARCAALWLAVMSLSLATPASGRCATPAEPTTAQTGQNVETGGAERTQLEIEKLRVEIEKLRKEIGVAWLAPIASIISVMSVAAVLIAMWFQRQTALQIQDRSEKSAFELKVADILMSSNAQWIAKKRLKILSSLYKDRISKEFVESFDREDFPGTLNRELKMDLFKAIAEKYSTPAEAIDVFTKLFPEENWWWKKFLSAMTETRPPTSEAIPSRETRA
jgi:hypothetical protein